MTPLHSSDRDDLVFEMWDSLLAMYRSRKDLDESMASAKPRPKTNQRHLKNIQDAYLDFHEAYAELCRDDVEIAMNSLESKRYQHKIFRPFIDADDIFNISSFYGLRPYILEVSIQILDRDEEFSMRLIESVQEACKYLFKCETFMPSLLRRELIERTWVYFGRKPETVPAGSSRTFSGRINPTTLPTK